MSKNFITELKGQTNLPRWFSSIFNMLKDPVSGRLVIQLKDGRKFLLEGKKAGANAKIIVKNGNF